MQTGYAFIKFIFAFVLSCTVAGVLWSDVFAQGWGWGREDYDRGPGSRQQGQAYGSQAAPTPGYRSPAFSQPNPRCRDLEFQLSGGSAPGSQEQLSRTENDLRQADAQYHRAQTDAERADCYEDMFLFGRSLKRSARCIDLDRQVQGAKARLVQLRAQRDGLSRRSSPRERRDEIIAELARNRCGENYTREYEQQRSRNSSIFSFFSDDDGDDGPRYQAPAPSMAGYQTKCVRLCDGFYFPVSYSTGESRFQDDQAKCQAQCVAPSELYVHRVDQDVEQMVSLAGRPYSALPNAFRNRKVYVRGCSCNQSEYSVDEIAKFEDSIRQQASGKRADATAKPAFDLPPALLPAVSSTADSAATSLQRANPVR